MLNLNGKYIYKKDSTLSLMGVQFNDEMFEFLKQMFLCYVKNEKFTHICSFVGSINEQQKQNQKRPRIEFNEITTKRPKFQADQQVSSNPRSQNKLQLHHSSFS